LSRGLSGHARGAGGVSVAGARRCGYGEAEVASGGGGGVGVEGEVFGEVFGARAGEDRVEDPLNLIGAKQRV
jgi:hypothetical protein